jgi:hypothetical protein
MAQVVDFSCSRAVAVTPSDTVPVSFGTSPLPSYFRRLHVGGPGAVKVLTTSGDAVVYLAAIAGYLWVQGTLVYATGTTATSIVAEY